MVIHSRLPADWSRPHERNLVPRAAVRAPAVGALSRADLEKRRRGALHRKQAEEDAHRRNGDRRVGKDPHARHGEVEGRIATVVGGQEFELGRILALRQRVVESVAVGDRAGRVEVVDDVLDVADAVARIGRIRDAERLVRLTGRRLDEAQIVAEPDRKGLRVRAVEILEVRILALRELDQRLRRQRQLADREGRRQRDERHLMRVERAEHVGQRRVPGKGDGVRIEEAL